MEFSPVAIATDVSASASPVPPHPTIPRKWDRPAFCLCRGMDHLKIGAMGTMTLRALAKQLGLGKSTVQRALAGSARVSKATRERVEQAAREAGFERDVYFSALSAKRRKAGKIRMPLHYFPAGRVSSGLPMGLDLHKQLAASGLEMGYEVIKVVFSEFPKLEAIPRILYQRGSRGLIVGMADLRLHEPLRKFGKLPVVCCQRQEGLPFHSARFGVADRMRMCWSKLWDAGYRRIGCAIMQHDLLINDDRDRLGTALELNEEHLPKAKQVPPLTSGMGDSDTFRQWLEDHRPDAVVGFSHVIWYWMRDAGFGDLPFVCLHARSAGDSRHTPGALQPKELLAREVLRQMDSLIRHGEIGVPAVPVHVVIPPVWHDGAGIPPANR